MIARVAALLERLQALVRWRRLDRDLEDDLQAHFDLLVDDLVAHGMEPATARREARLRFGTMASAMEAHREARSVRGLETFARDLRYAARLVRKQPGLTAAVVLILAVGIALPASALSLINGFLFRAPVSRDPDAFVRVTRPDGHSASRVASLPEYLAFRQARSLREVAAWSSLRLRAPLGDEEPARVVGQLVSCNFLRLFGVDAPVAGRLLVDDDCASDVPVAIISDATWRTRFNADPAVIGRTLPYGQTRIVVVGVASAPPLIDQWDDPDLVAALWIPYTALPSVKDAMEVYEGLNLLSAGNAHLRWFDIAGLLAPGSTREAAAAELEGLQATVPPPARPRDLRVGLSDGTRWAVIDADDVWSVFLMMLSLPVLIMVMTCVNVAALLLSRAVNRQQEMAIRRALGTSQAGLFRMVLTEHLLIAAIAGVASVVLVYTVPPILVWQLDAATSFGAARPDWRVFCGMALAVLLAAVLSGLTPARAALRPDTGDSLLARLGSSARARRGRSGRTLVGVQVAASMVPLVVAVAFARAADRYTHLEFARGDLIVADVPPDKSRALTASDVAARVAASPVVAKAALVANLPLLIESSDRFTIPGQPLDVDLVRSQVSPEFFDVFDIPVLTGTAFDSTAAALNPQPAIVSRQFASRFFPDGNALGQVIGVTRGDARRLSIIGIAADRPTGLSMMSGTLNDGSIVYEPLSPTATGGSLAIRPAVPVAAAADALAPLLRDLVGMPIPITTFQARLDERVATVRDVQKILVGLGVVALMLAVIGVVGSVAFEVNRRRKEFAIQMALGAGPWIVRRGVMRSGLRPLPISLSLGLLAAWGAVRAAETMRMLPLPSYAVDPVPYVVVALLVVAIAVATLLAVAYPAGRRDPLPALRED